jgi:hypothetical protein
LSKQIAKHDDASSDEQEVAGEIEEDNLEKEPRENEKSIPAPFMSE